MAEYGGKIRYAMGLFEDVPSLKRAAAALVGLGIAPPSLCVAGDSAAVEATGTESWAETGGSPAVLPLHHDGGVLGVLAEGAPLWSRDTPAARSLGAKASESFHATDIWTAVTPHLCRGALLLIAQAPSAALQDEAMRILLRYSRYPVHAEEFIRLI